MEPTFSMKAPGQMRDQRLTCPVTGALLTIDGNGIVSGLSQAQVDDLFLCGYRLTEGNELLEVRARYAALGSAAMALEAIEKPLADAIRAARAAGVPESALFATYRDEAKRLGTALPSPADLAGPVVAPTAPKAPVAPTATLEITTPAKLGRPPGKGKAKMAAGEIADPAAYAAALADGTLREIDPDSPEATAQVMEDGPKVDLPPQE